MQCGKVHKEYSPANSPEELASKRAWYERENQKNGQRPDLSTLRGVLAYWSDAVEPLDLCEAVEHGELVDLGDRAKPYEILNFRQMYLNDRQLFMGVPSDEPGDMTAEARFKEMYTAEWMYLRAKEIRSGAMTAHVYDRLKQEMSTYAEICKELNLTGRKAYSYSYSALPDLNSFRRFCGNYMFKIDMGNIYLLANVFSSKQCAMIQKQLAEWLEADELEYSIQLDPYRYRPSDQLGGACGYTIEITVTW